jgi:hypothetical protein
MDNDFEERDDYNAYVQVLRNAHDAHVTAYLNDTADGVRLRYRNKIYEIPQKHLQDAIISEFGSVQGKKVHYIKQRDGVFCIANKHEDNTSTWTCRGNLSSRIGALDNKVKNTLFSHEIRQLLEQKGEAEKEYLQEKC